MMNKKDKNLVVKSLFSVLLIGALILTISTHSNSFIIAGRDEVIGEIVSADIIDIAGDDLVGGELVKANTIYEGILV